MLKERTIQLVLADEKLRDADGIQFLERIMYEYPECTRMVQIGKGGLDRVIRAVERGIVFSYVIFPWQREELKIAIDGAMEVYYLKVQNRNLEGYLEEVKQGQYFSLFFTESGLEAIRK